MVSATTPTNHPRPEWTWVTGGGGNGTYRCKLDDADFSTGFTETTQTTFTPGTDLGAGLHTLYVRERNAALQWSASGSFTVEADFTPPTAPEVAGPSSTTDVRPAWNWTSGGGGNGTYRFRLDHADLTQGATVAATLWFAPDAPISLGSHTLYVQERDAAGNWSPSGTHTIDITMSTQTTWVVALGQAHRRLVSPDLGLTWSVDEHDAPDTQPSRFLTRGMFGNGVFVAVGGEFSGVGPVRVTTNMVDWNSTMLPDSVIASVFGNGMFVVGNNNTYLATSADGETWDNNYIDTAVRALGFGNGIFLATGEPHMGFSWSTDGLLWQATAPLETNAGTDQLAYGAGRFLIGGCGAGTLVTRNGLNLEAGTTGVDVCHGMAYGNGVFMSTQCLTSVDGLVWQPMADCPAIFVSVTSAGGYVFGASSNEIWRTTNGDVWTRVYGTSPAGLELEGIFSGTMDVPLANAPLVTAITPTNAVRPTWTWTPGGNGNGTYRFKLDDADLSTGFTETNLTAFTATADQAEGSHTLYVRERNAALQWSDSGAFTVDIDLTPPNAPVVSGVTPTTNLQPTWTWTPGGGGSGTYRIKLDDADLTTGATETMATLFTPGTPLTATEHRLYVQERDTAGSWSVSGSFAISVQQCGNTVCESGEDCLSCPGDCVACVGNVVDEMNHPIPGSGIEPEPTEISANRFVAPANMAINTMKIKIYSAPTGSRLRLAVYSDATGPAAVLAATDEFTPIEEWNEVTLNTMVTLNAGTTYWLAYYANDLPALPYWNFNGNMGDEYWKVPNAFPELPSGPGGWSKNVCILNMYAIYR